MDAHTSQPWGEGGEDLVFVAHLAIGHEHQDRIAQGT
jgi:hypothetical protein